MSETEVSMHAIFFCDWAQASTSRPYYYVKHASGRLTLGQIILHSSSKLVFKTIAYINGLTRLILLLLYFKKCAP